MSPARNEAPVPVARLVLRRVVAVAPSGPPVFHVFEELFERARQRAERDLAQVGANGRSA